MSNLARGRDMDELLRVVDALQYSERRGQVRPSDEPLRRSGSTLTECGVAAYLAEHSDML